MRRERSSFIVMDLEKLPSFDWATTRKSVVIRFKSPYVLVPLIYSESLEIFLGES